MSVLGQRLSDEFDIDESWLRKNSVFNPTLDIDSPLFVDPFLLPYSTHAEFSECGAERYEEHFTEIFKLIRVSREPGDKAWNSALRKFRLGEVKGIGGTCLGYSKHSTQGRGFGAVLSQRALKWAKDVIELGVIDPELFSSLSLFEEGIGADLISDMVTNIIIDCILKFNKRIISEINVGRKIKLPLETFEIRGYSAELIPNPYSSRNDPILLLPSDVLKYFPILDDPSDLAKIAEQNAGIREKVNNHISEIFKLTLKKDKKELLRLVMRDSEAFQAFLDTLKLAENKPYDIENDPIGLLDWVPQSKKFSKNFGTKLFDNPKLADIDRIDSIVGQILEKFKELIEKNRMNRVFYVQSKPRHEKFSQLLFFAIASSYCDANSLDISPESDAGAGPVDFKLSVGDAKVVVEIKLSTNSKIVSGYQAQINAYKEAEKAGRAHYVIINVGGLGEKWNAVKKLNEAAIQFNKSHSIHLINGILRPSASKLRIDGDEEE